MTLELKMLALSIVLGVGATVLAAHAFSRVTFTSYPNWPAIAAPDLGSPLRNAPIFLGGAWLAGNAMNGTIAQALSLRRVRGGG